ncbi:hypothetical protein N8I77_005373 [Diaporthe amygdali]|uniref:Uncharacterized protein n=1 Tax=Phomopsis amygdali TaxID=1214568 RepID=A0AAD9W3B8_PHOAM|nr:hypothetical protein N8I77_005373 [Diaporthe amygdali]
MSDNKNEINMPQLTGRDMELLICALRSAENGFPKIDYNKMADMANLKNGRVASACFSLVKKKVMGEAGATKATPKKETPSKRKQSAAAAAEAGDTDESPPKKAKTATKKSAKKQEETKEEDDEDEGSAFI